MRTVMARNERVRTSHDTLLSGPVSTPVVAEPNLIETDVSNGGFGVSC
jgi:hypothetical protein